MAEPVNHFLRQIVAEDLRSGRHQRVVTRFPPEPNGYLHIGHAKSICLNFGLAAEFGGTTYLRMDDTNPLKEEDEYVEGIQADVAWLGFRWEALTHASDAFGQMADWAEHLIHTGHAYVCGETEEAMRAGRGTVTTPGTPSPWRDRPRAESLDLFRRMRAGEFVDGALTLRARIDMSSPNMKMRDPPLYRIRHAHHHRTGDAWCIYPMYDYAHPLGDALEGITHSICTLEFENNRELYDWVIAHCPVPCRPRQYEFARLNLQGTMMSKRRLLALVREGHVHGWDDPRMPTLAGLRRRGVRPSALRDFAERVGVARADNLVRLDLLEASIRDDLEPVARRALAVLDPLPIEVTNWDADRVAMWMAPWFPDGRSDGGERALPFGRHLLIERADFREAPEAGFKRLVPGGSVRLRHGPVLRCDAVVRDATGTVVGLRGTVDEASRGVPSAVKTTLHWVARDHAVRLPVRLYGRLFTVDRPDMEEDFRTCLDPQSRVDRIACCEPALTGFAPGEPVQFERLGFFSPDPVESIPGTPVWNRVVALRDAAPKAASSVRAAPVAGPPPPTKAPDPAAAPFVARGVGDEEARVLAHDPALAALFDAALPHRSDPRGLAALVVHAARPALRDGARPSGERLATVAQRLADGVIGNRGVDALLRSTGDVDADIDAIGLRLVTDEATVGAWVDASFAAAPDKAEAFAGGRNHLQGFFVGDTLRRSGGRADPNVVARLVRRRGG